MASTWVGVLAAAVPQAVALLLFLSAPARRARLVQRHSELLAKLPTKPETLAEPLRVLLAKEVEALAADGKRRLDRKLNKASLAAIVFVAVFGAAASWGLWQLDHLLFRTLAVFIALFGFLLITVGGLPQLFSPPRDKSASRSRDAKEA